VNNLMHGWSEELKIPPLVLRKSDLEGLKLSVVIPTLNQVGTIEDTILSIINQNYRNYEIIIMDGGSNDGTLEVVKKYEDWVDFLISGDDSGQSNAINKGFQLASGDIFSWINSDDYYLPGAFSKVVKVFTESSAIDIVVGNGEIVTLDHKFLKHIKAMTMTRENLLQWINDKWIMQQSCFWRASIWEDSGGVDENLELLMDFDLWLRFAELGKSAMIDEDIAVMRYYQGVKTVSLKSKMKEELGYVYAKNGALFEVRRLIHDLLVINQNLTAIIEEKDNRLISKIMRRLKVEI